MKKHVEDAGLLRSKGARNDGKGRFVVVEGLEGAGKSTVVDEVIRFLQTKSIPVIQTREPGGTQIGEKLRDIIKSGVSGEEVFPEAELLLMYASRVQLLNQVIYPALEAGTWVVSDRFELSSFAYQGGGRQLSMTMIQALSDFCLKGFKPDKLFFLDIMPEKGLERTRLRGEADRIERESEAFFSRVYHAYHTALSQYPKAQVIPANLPFETVMTQIHTGLDSLIHEAHCAG